MLYAVIHGGGFGPQPAANRKWIDKTMADSSEKATWLPKPKKKKAVPTVGVAQADGIVIKFKGTLQTATTQNGPWQDDKIAKSPLTVTLNGHEKFFRSR